MRPMVRKERLSQESQESDTSSSDAEAGGKRGGQFPGNYVTQNLSHWYSCQKVSEWQVSPDGNPELVRYQSAKLVSLRVLCVHTGTILKNKVVWIEVLLIMVLFIAAGAFTMGLQTWGKLVFQELNDQFAQIAAYCQVLTTITTFVMGFFTTTNYNRWWRLRTEGVGSTWAATGQITMLLSAFVTRDEEVLTAISRYARASLMWVTMGQRNQRDKLDLLHERGLLTMNEVDMLEPLKSSPNAAICLWQWNACIINGLNEKGLIKQGEVLWQLLTQVQKGCGCVQLILNQLAAPVPMSYAALIGLLVKVHNLTYALLYGAVATVDFQLHLGKTTFALEICRTFILTLFFTAMLSLNQGLMDPFDGTCSDADFPMARIDGAIKNNLADYVTMAKRLPAWIGQAGLAGSVKGSIQGSIQGSIRGSMHARTQ